MEIAVQLYILLAALESGLAELSWRRWSFYDPRGPVEYGYRKSRSVWGKGPDFRKCVCASHNDCQIDYKFNEAALEFFQLRGLLTAENVRELKKENRKKKLLRRSRRNTDDIIGSDDECCCFLRKVMMPTFITEKEFNDTLHRMAN